MRLKLLFAALAAVVGANLPAHVPLAGDPRPRVASVTPHGKASPEEWQRAQDFLEKALRARPQDADVMARYGTMLRLRGDKAGASGMLYHALALSPTNLAVTLELAEVEREAWGNLGAAGQLLYQATVAHPSSARAHSSYASLLQSVGERDAAIWHYHASTDLDPSAPEVQTSLAALLKERGEDDAGDVAMRRALQTSPTDNALLCEHAESLLEAALEHDIGSAARQRLAQEARRALESALRLIPSDVAALMSMAAFHQSYSKDLQGAKAFIERAWACAPNDASIGLGLGRLCLSQGKLEQGLDVLREVVGRCPRNAASWCTLGQTQLALNDTEALESFEAALELDPDHVPSLSGYGLALKKLDGDWEGAEAAYKTALRIKPDDVATLCNLGKFHEEVYHDEDDALHYYMKALEVDPGNVRALFWRGRIYEEERLDLDSAEDFYIQTAKYGQHSEQHEERYLCAEALTRIGYIKWLARNQTKTARVFYESALTILPTHPRALRQEAALFAHLGLPQPALCLYSSALRVNPSDIDVRAELADICQILNYTQYALERYEEVLKVRPNDAPAMRGLANLIKQIKGGETAESKVLLEEAKIIEEREKALDQAEEEEIEEYLRKVKSGSSVRMTHEQNGVTTHDEEIQFEKPHGVDHDSDDGIVH